MFIKYVDYFFGYVWLQGCVLQVGCVLWWQDFLFGVVGFVDIRVLQWIDVDGCVVGVFGLVIVVGYGLVIEG